MQKTKKLRFNIEIKNFLTLTGAAFLDLNLSIHNDIVSTKIYKRDDFNFDIVNFPFLDGDVPQRPSYSEYIYQLFALPEHLRMLLRL